ncbi:hypothetical protein JXM67_12265 [candidate division WOR-3 bacterium]|nr:hypothetical protein [candidate division WOR-3 bacterium]
MNHRLRYDEMDKILFLQLVEDVSEDEYQAIADTINSYPSEKRMPIIVDAKNSLNSALMNRKTRKILAEGVRTVPGTRLAMVLSNPALRMISKVFLTFFRGNSETRFFES